MKKYFIGIILLVMVFSVTDFALAGYFPNQLSIEDNTGRIYGHHTYQWRLGKGWTGNSPTSTMYFNGHYGCVMQTTLKYSTSSDYLNLQFDSELPSVNADWGAREVGADWHPIGYEYDFWHFHASTTFNPNYYYVLEVTSCGDQNRSVTFYGKNNGPFKYYVDGVYQSDFSLALDWGFSETPPSISLYSLVTTSTIVLQPEQWELKLENASSSDNYIVGVESYDGKTYYYDTGDLSGFEWEGDMYINIPIPRDMAIDTIYDLTLWKHWWIRPFYIKNNGSKVYGPLVELDIGKSLYFSAVASSTVLTMTCEDDQLNTTLLSKLACHAKSVFIDTINYVFVPSNNSVSIIRSQFETLKNIFPFNLFFNVGSSFKKSASQSVSNDSLVIELPTKDTSTKINWVVLSSSTISNVLGNDVYQNFYNAFKAVIWIATTYASLRLII